MFGEKSDYVDIDTFTQEVRLTSDFDGPINFLLGGYYFNEKVNQQSAIKTGDDFRVYGDALIRAASGNALNVDLLEGTLGALEGDPAKYLDSFFRAGDGLDEAYKMKNEAFSIFGTVDFDFTDRLTRTLGGNFTRSEERRVRQ